jgi:glycosidase
MRAAMLGALRHWLDAGVDGFRMDVAGFVPDAFWREITPALRASVDRPILLLAEWADPKMIDLGFDLIYPWENYERLKATWRGGSAAAFVDAEIANRAALPPGGGRLRFTTNHDQTAWEDVPLAIFGGAAGARAAFTAMALLPGRPMLYNGQEIESPVRLRLFERDPIDWSLPDAAAIRAHYARVMDLAASLRDRGISDSDLVAVVTSAPADVIAYRRHDLVVLVNARDRAVRFAVDGFPVDGTTDLLTGATQRGDTVTLAPHGTRVLMPGSP